MEFELAIANTQLQMEEMAARLAKCAREGTCLFLEHAWSAVGLPECWLSICAC